MLLLTRFVGEINPVTRSSCYSRDLIILGLVIVGGLQTYESQGVVNGSKAGIGLFILLR